MKTCEKYEKILVPEICGGPGREKTEELKEHFSICPDCQRKAEEMQELLRKVRETAHIPRLSAWESENMTWTIMRSLKKEKESGQNFPSFLRFRLAPALLAACLILFFTGWFGLREWQSHDPVQTANALKAEEMQIIKNYELISNLEMLEEMDNLEKLVETVDEEKYGELGQSRFLVQKTDGEENHVC